MTPVPASACEPQFKKDFVAPLMFLSNAFDHQIDVTGPIDARRTNLDCRPANESHDEANLCEGCVQDPGNVRHLLGMLDWICRHSSSEDSVESRL